MKKLFNLKKLKSSTYEGFAKEIVDNLAKRYPPELDQEQAKRMSVNRLTRIIEDMCAQVQEFQRTHEFGFIGKARVANNIQWTLKERGYTKKFVEFATEAIVIHLNK